MKEFRIVNIKGYDYELVDGGNRLYKISMNFYELGRKPYVGARIFISPQLLDRSYDEFSDFYYFGRVDSKYGRSQDAQSYKIDIIEVEFGGEMVRLQRHYG